MCTLRLQCNGFTVNICLLFSPRKKRSSYIVILNEIQISAPNKLIHLREQKPSDSESYNHLWEIHKKNQKYLLQNDIRAKAILLLLRFQPNYVNLWYYFDWYFRDRS